MDRANGLDVETVNKVMWQIPNALCLVGSRAGDERNVMTQSWVTQVSMEPVLVAISVDATAVTNRLIRAGGVFTVNLWDQADTRVFVKFSKPAVKEGESLNGRPIRVGITGAPIFISGVNDGIDLLDTNNLVAVQGFLDVAGNSVDLAGSADTVLD